MKLDHLVDHLTEASTMRAIAWTLGAIVSFSFILSKEFEKSLSVLTLTAGVAGAIGVSTSDRKRVKEMLGGTDDENIRDE